MAQPDQRPFLTSSAARCCWRTQSFLWKALLVMGALNEVAGALLLNNINNHPYHHHLQPNKRRNSHRQQHQQQQQQSSSPSSSLAFWLQPLEVTTCPRRRETAQWMGLRDILRFRRKKKDSSGNQHSHPLEEDDDDDNSHPSQLDNTQPASSSTSTPSPRPAFVPFQPTPPPPLRMGEDPTTKEVNVHALDGDKESVQERINRVKSGKMTEEEKFAFLQSTLKTGGSAGDGTLSSSSSSSARRFPGLIKEHWGDLEAGAAAVSSKNKRKKQSNASPFPSDSILRNFARGKEKNNNGTGAGAGASGGLFPTSPDNVLLNAGLDSQKKKREYLDMVTDPERFQRYKLATPAPSSGASSANNAPLPPDLGARLGAAAMANESLRQQQQQQQQESNSMDRYEYEQRAEEVARQQQAEAARKETDLLMRRRQNEQAKLKEEDQKKESEKERLNELMKAQEAFWAKKLAEERESMARREKQHPSTTKPTKLMGGGMTQPKRSAVSPPAPSVAAAPAPAQFNPDEHELLEMAEHDRQEDWKHNQEIIEMSKARELGNPSIPAAPQHMQTDVDFLEEQARKKRELDRKRDEQLQKLRELNSPLPNLEDESVHGRKKSPNLFGRKDPPAPAPQATSSSSLFSSLPRETGSESGPSKPAANFEPQYQRSPSTTPSISDLTQQWKSRNADSSSAHTTTTTDSSTAKRSAWSSFLGYDPSQAANRNQPQSSSPSAAPVGGRGGDAAARSPERKGPIRMELPLVSDPNDDDDDDDGVDVAANKGLSIADAMKRTTKGGTIGQEERSKKWGVDMSRFLDK